MSSLSKFICLILLFSIYNCDHKEEENLLLSPPWMECGAFSICIAKTPKSDHPEFIGIWKNQDFTDSCTQTTITYNFNDTVVSLWTFDQMKDACATHSNYNLQLEWKIDSGQYCEKVWMSDVSPWNCYSYSINSTDLIIDSKTYTKQ